MFSGFTEINIPVEPDVTIHGLKSHPSSSSGSDDGNKPALLLLHGFPQNLLIWHRVAEPLSAKYSVVALDLRGYGQSSKPAGDDQHVAYSKTVMARDVVTAMKRLGHERFYVCAHDRGARVTHRLCVDYPDVVIKAIFLDIAPTLAMYGQTDFEFAKYYSHWFFLIKAAPFPEKMILGDPATFAEGHMGASRHGSSGTGIFEKECWDSYVRGLSDPAGVHAMCEDYRASASVDMEEARRDVEQGRKIKCPLVVLWGAKGVIQLKFDALKEWREVSDGTVEGEAVDCGHYLPEEKPQEVSQWIEKFFV